MKIFIKHLILSAIALIATSCYNEISLDEYRNENGQNLLTINSLLCPDSAISVMASNMFFFPDKHDQHNIIEDLDMNLFINNEDKGKDEVQQIIKIVFKRYKASTR